MTMTDPIADMLTRIRNANVAMHDVVNMPASKQKVALAGVLQKEGYIEGYTVAPSTSGPGDVLTVNLSFFRSLTLRLAFLIYLPVSYPYFDCAFESAFLVCNFCPYFINTIIVRDC